MKKIDLGQTISIVANVGVIVGIVFLAIELRQSNRLTQLEANSLSLERNSDFNFTIAGDEELSRIWFDGLADIELDPLDDARFGMLCEQRFWYAIILDQSSKESPVNAAIVRRNIEGSSRLRKCWDDMKDRASSYDYDWFVQAVDSENIDY